MTIWFVSRHPGAIAWAHQAGFEVDQMVDHLSPEQVREGDIVIGTLPINLACEICNRKARYLHMRLDLAREDRGRELSVEDMVRCRARLEEYFLTRADNKT
jgi:CRISPR-associated protein Csx16